MIRNILWGITNPKIHMFWKLTMMMISPHMHLCLQLRMRRYFQPESGEPVCSPEALAMYRDPKKRSMAVHAVDFLFNLVFLLYSMHAYMIINMHVYPRHLFALPRGDCPWTFPKAWKLCRGGNGGGQDVETVSFQHVGRWLAQWSFPSGSAQVGCVIYLHYALTLTSVNFYSWNWSCYWFPKLALAKGDDCQQQRVGPPEGSSATQRSAWEGRMENPNGANL